MGFWKPLAKSNVDLTVIVVATVVAVVCPLTVKLGEDRLTELTLMKGVRTLHPEPLIPGTGLTKVGARRKIFPKADPPAAAPLALKADVDSISNTACPFWKRGVALHSISTPNRERYAEPS